MIEIDEADCSAPGSVYIIDDDREIRSSVVLLLRAEGIPARPFARAEDFLEEVPHLEPACLLVDIRMPGMSGLELLSALRERHCHWPAVVITGHGEIAVAVRAVKLGAVEFLEKPFSDEELQYALREAFKRLPESAARSRRMQAARETIARLSARERQVFEGIVSGLTNKQIAQAYSLSPRTIESYRVNMMAKLDAQNVRDLMNIANFANPANG